MRQREVFTWLEMMRLAILGAVVTCPRVAWADGNYGGNALCEGYIFSIWALVPALPLWGVAGTIAAILSKKLRRALWPHVVALLFSFAGGLAFIFASSVTMNLNMYSRVLTFAPPAVLGALPVVAWYVLYTRRGAAQPGVEPAGRLRARRLTP
jgi:hypothetical protein